VSNSNLLTEAVTAGSQPQSVVSSVTPVAKNVILLIGDGMGSVQRDAARLLGGALAMEDLPFRAHVCTSCADPVATITDSAAAATAIATGVKTYNGAIGVGPDGQPVPTVLELAKQAGKSVGLVTTCQVTDATPAAFAAHVVNRIDHREIARQFIEETRVDLILGGGGRWWLPDEASDPDLPAPVDLTARAQELGYVVATTAAELRATCASRVLGLFAGDELFVQDPVEGEVAKYDPPVALWELTHTALDTLSANPDGFFLMIEEAAIDRMGHRNNTALAIKGVHELDRAVTVARAFAERDGETLVIVTADHECGGLVFDEAFVTNGTSDDSTELDLSSLVRWATTGHTDVDVPLNAYGPGSDRLTGQLENIDLFTAMVDAMGLSRP
jgi:alkaline phosphatase